MSGFVSGYGEDTEPQRQYEDYPPHRNHLPLPGPPPGMTMGIPPPDHYYHHLHRAPSGTTSGSSPPTHPAPYVPQNYAAAMSHPSQRPMSSSPLMMAQGISYPPPHHQGMPPSMLPYPGMPPTYVPPHYQIPPPGYPYAPPMVPSGPPPPPTAAEPVETLESTTAATTTTTATALPDDSADPAAIYAHPEPLTHPRAPKSATTMEQIQIMQEAFKREQDSSRRRQTSAYAEAAARRAARTGMKPAEYGTAPGLTSSASASPTSSAGSVPSTEFASSAPPPPLVQSNSNGSFSRLPTIITKRKDAAVLDQDEQGRVIVRYTDSDEVYYMGSAPLGVEDDKYWLSELQVCLREKFAEAFSASEEDIAVLMHGRNKPIALGQIGIRCVWCKHNVPSERGQQATSYPSQISGIYNAVQQMLRLHLDCCASMPAGLRDRLEHLRMTCSSRGGRKQYWIDSAKRIGLVDTPTGIHFARNPVDPLPPLSGPSVAARDATALRKKRPPVASASASTANVQRRASHVKAPRSLLHDENMEEAYGGSILDINMPSRPPPDAPPLVFPEDKHLISDYLYLTLEQMAPCTLMEADCVGCYKTRNVGFPGMACRHCVGQAGSGRYFPASEASLSQTTTSQTILNHVRNCSKCPAHIRDELEIMKREKTGQYGRRQEKPKHGGRKVFFHRLWCRIQGLEIDEEEDLEEPRSHKKGRRKRDDDDDEDDVSSMGASDSGTYDNELSSAEKSKGKRASPRSSPDSVKVPPWVHGCVCLSKKDDFHWLSDMECFARTELVEVFSYSEGDSLAGYAGRKAPCEGQVGIRCVYCKELPPHERSNGCILFPTSVDTLHSKVADMVRLHFPSCSSLPENIRHTFKSLRGFDAKVSTDDSHQFWIDAAHDVGLSDLSPGGNGTWGITFRRDPVEPSPADELDLEKTIAPGAASGSLVKPEDRGLCTDQVILLMRQIQPCRYTISDKRGHAARGRGRVRVLGFPGLCCRHCDGHSTQGRYFPPSAKNLTDSTVNSLLTHVISCSHCPQPIRASLNFLGHRAIQQKTDLGGSWKKYFLQKVWDRLHVEMEWADVGTTPILDLSDDYNQPSISYEEEDSLHEPNDDGGEEQDQSGGNQMNALIKAAAIWLTEQDGSKTGSKRDNDGTPGSLDSIEGSGVKRRRAV